MKKLVTIRKARKGEKPGFLNKTAKFLKKAEMGTEVESESGEYNEKLLSYVAEQMLELGQDAKSVYETLIESKIEPEVAASHIQAIMEFQQNMQEQEPATPVQDQETAYSEAADEVEQDLASDYGYYDPSGQGTNLAQDTQEEDEVNADSDQMVTDIVNNEWTGQDGGSIDQYIVNNYLPVFGDSSQEDFEAFNYKQGGKVSKRKFMKGVMSELKKAREGMQQESPENQKFDMTDTLLLDRTKKKDKFVSALSKTTQEAKDKERAEQMWQQQQMMVQQPQSMDPSIPLLNRQEGGDGEHIYHHLAMMQDANNYMSDNPMNSTLSARGGISMPSPREYRKMHKQVSRMLPNIYLDPNIKSSELNVTRTGLLGRPKEYSIKFQGNQGIMPGWGHGTLLLGLPGGSNMGPNMFGGRWGSGRGVGYTKGIMETKKVIHEGILRNVNAKADPQKNSEKAKLYPQSTPYPGVSDSPAPAGTEITKDELGRDIVISPEEAKRREEHNNHALQFYSPSGPNPNQIVPGSSSPSNPAVSSGSFFPSATAVYDPYQQTLTYPDGRVVKNPSSEEIQKALMVSGNPQQQYGGFVDPNNPNLYKFIYGGGDNMFEDDMNTVNTADPYFGRMYREGGMPSFEGGGMWVTKPDGTTVFLKDDGSVDKTKVMTDAEKKTYDETTLKGHQDYYTKNKNQFVNQSEQQKMIDDAVNQRMQQYTSQYGQPGRMQSYGYNAMPGYRSNGFLDQLFSSNLTPEYLGTWSKMKDVRTSNGQPFTGFNKNMVLNEVDVRRSGMRGQPKAYTMKFNQYRDPRDANKITLNPAENRANDPAGFNAQGSTQPGTGTSDKALQPRGTYRDLGLFDQMRIRANERQTDRRAGDEPAVDPGNQPMSNEEMLKSQGKVWDEQQQRWVTKTTPSSSLFKGSNPVTPNTGTANMVAPGESDLELPANRPVPQRMFQQPVVANQSNLTAENSSDQPVIPDKETYLKNSLTLNQPSTNTKNSEIPAEVLQALNINSPNTNPFEQPNSDLQRFTSGDFNSGTGISDYNSFNQNDVFMRQGNNSGNNSEPITNTDTENTSGFSANPYDRSMMPFNPDNEQSTEYEFGVDPLTGSSSNDVAINNPNGLYDDVNNKNWFAQEPTSKPIIPTQPKKRVYDYRSNPLSQQLLSKNFNPSSQDYFNLKNRFNPKHDYNKTYTPQEDRALYESQRQALYNDRNAQLTKIFGTKNFKLDTKEKQRIYNNLLQAYELKENQINSRDPYYQKNGGGPVAYTNNPAFVGKSNIDLLSENGDVAVPGLQPSSFWNDSQSFNKAQPTIFDNCTEDEKKDPNSTCYDREKYGYQIDPNQQISDTLKKDMMEKTGEVEIDMKNKDVLALEAAAYIGLGNRAASIVPGITNRREANKRLGNKKLKKTADGLYANNPAGDPWQSKGQYSISGSTYGLLDPRNAGQINYSGRSQYGGSIYKEGGVAYMTAEEMQRFMEDGGEIEFI